MNNTLSDWIHTERTKRGWSMRELARRGGISVATISDIENEKVNIGMEACRAIARAFGLPPETVLRRAGLLPPEPEETVTSREMLYMFLQLDEEDQERIMDITRTFLEKRG